MDSSLRNKVTKKSMKQYPKIKRALINRHRSLQSKQLMQELRRLMLLENSCDEQNKPVSKNFQRGYLNAVTEVSRLLASIPNVDVEMGKVIMTHLGLIYNRLMTQSSEPNTMHLELMNDSPPASPASSGYCSDTEGSEIASNVWRPW